MKRLSTIVLLCGMVFVANVFAMSEADKEKYRKELKRDPGRLDTALAIDEDGMWAGTVCREYYFLQRTPFLRYTKTLFWCEPLRSG